MSPNIKPKRTTSRGFLAISWLSCTVSLGATARAAVFRLNPSRKLFRVAYIYGLQDLSLLYLLGDYEVG